MVSRLSAWAAAGALTVAASACGADSAAGSASLDVVAAFYPLEFVADRIGGEHASVTSLASPGVEPHDLELSPSQVADLASADLVIYLSGFQPAVDEAVEATAGAAKFDLAAAVPLIGAAAGQPAAGDHPDQDPHVWLDPVRMAGFATELAAEFGARDPDHAAEYTANAEALGADLAALDREYTDGLADCQRREIVVSHAAFGYLADRYDLTQVAITGLSPEAEPSPQRLAEVIGEAERTGATTIFFEVLVSPEVAQVIADQVGADTAVLDPIEGLAGGSDEDYFSLMRNNLAALRAALGCP